MGISLAMILLTRILIMAAVGLACEVLFTALSEYRKTGDLRLRGFTYIWMLPIYAVIYPALSVLYPRLAGLPFPARGAVYVLLIYAVEYSSGRLLRTALGEAPWEREYRGARWAVDALIRLDYAPAWFAAALCYEWVFRVLRGSI